MDTPPNIFNPATRAYHGKVPAFILNLAYKGRKAVAQARGLSLALPYPRGVDGNNWVTNNLLDPAALAHAAPFAYWKAVEGTWWVDPSHPKALTLRQQGMIVFLYAFFRRNAPGVTQANWFDGKMSGMIQQIGGEKICLIDYETADGVTNTVGNGNFKAMALRLRALGYKVGLYTSPSKAVEFGLTGLWVNNYVDFFILAHYKANNSPTIPAGWDASKVMAQQEGVLGLHAWVQPLPGIQPQFDCNLLLWSVAELEAFTGQKYTPGQLPPPPPPPGDDMPVLTTCLVDGLKMRSLPHVDGTDANKIDNIGIGEIVERWFVHTEDPLRIWYAVKRINAPLAAERNRLGYAAYTHPDLGGKLGFDKAP